MKRCALSRGTSLRLAVASLAPSLALAAALQVAAVGSLRAAPETAFRKATRAEPPAIHVDRESFWYEEGPACAELERYSLPCAPAGTGERVARAVDAAVRFHPGEFSAPPPYETVVRARPRETLPGGFRTVADLMSYGGAELVGDTAFIDVNLTAFIGETPLNDAELRSFLAHELKHAYQFVSGPPPRNSPELWRREVEAHEWELAHMEPGVRSWYRAEAIFNLEMYRRLLASE